MSATLDARLRLNSAEFTGGLNRATREVHSFVGRVGQQFMALRNVFMGGALGVGGGLAIGNMLGTAAEHEKYARMLAQVSGGANAAALELAELKKLSLSPGLDLQSAVTATVRLRMMGQTSDEVRASISAIANKVAELGGGGVEMQGVLMAFSQISAKGKVFAEEINQIAERIPSVRRDMKELFGTANTEELQKMNLSAEDFINTILGKWSQAPPMVSGLTEDIKNFKMTMEELKASGGLVFAPLVASANSAITVIQTLHRAAVNTLDNVFGGRLQQGEWAAQFAGEMERKLKDATIENEMAILKAQQDEERLRLEKEKHDQEVRAFRQRRSSAIDGAKSLIDSEEERLGLVQGQLAEITDIEQTIRDVNTAYEDQKDISDELLSRYQHIVKLKREEKSINDSISRKNAQAIQEKVDEEMLDPRERKRRMREEYDENRARKKVLRREEREALREEEAKARKNRLDGIGEGKFWDKDEARKRIRENIAEKWKDAFKDSVKHLKSIEQILGTLATA